LRDYRRARLEFAEQYVNWGLNEWGKVLFTDESKFCLFASDNRVKVYRRTGERYAECNIQPRVNFGGGFVIVRRA
jgi:hypothetical protein